MINQTEFIDEVVKVFVASVDMSFSTDTDDAVKVMDINMDENPEEACEDLCADLLKILGERYTCKTEKKNQSPSTSKSNKCGQGESFGE